MALALLSLFLAIPYLLPVNSVTVDVNNLPFKNSRFDTINEVTLHYRLFTPKESVKGNVLMVHGFSASTFCWRKNYDSLLNNGFRIVAVDVPGFGYSDKDLHHNYSTSEKVKIFNSLINKIDSVNKWNLIGHSMGGGIVCSMAAMYPKKIQSLIMVDGVGSSFKKEKRKWFPNIFYCNRYTYRWAEVALKNYFLSEKQFKKLLSSAYAQEADIAAIKGYMEPFKIQNSAAAIFAMSGNSYETEDAYIDKIFCPTAIIWGTKDTWLPIKLGENYLKKKPQSIFYKIEGAGHCGMETHPEVFNNYLISFLNQNGNFK